jgi:hypothetical protein
MDAAEQWEPDEARASRPVLRARGGEIPPRDSPQSGVASPLLSVIYMNLTKRGEAFHAHVVSYADDFVIPQPWTCGCGSDLDEGSDDKTRADVQ